jgi:hypothetical protein
MTPKTCELKRIGHPEAPFAGLLWFPNISPSLTAIDDAWWDTVGKPLKIL